MFIKKHTHRNKPLCRRKCPNLQPFQTTSDWEWPNFLTDRKRIKCIFRFFSIYNNKKEMLFIICRLGIFIRPIIVNVPGDRKWLERPAFLHHNTNWMLNCWDFIRVKKKTHELNKHFISSVRSTKSVSFPSLSGSFSQLVVGFIEMLYLFIYGGR